MVIFEILGIRVVQIVFQRFLKFVLRGLFVFNALTHRHFKSLRSHYSLVLVVGAGPTIAPHRVEAGGQRIYITRHVEIEHLSQRNLTKQH